MKKTLKLFPALLLTAAIAVPSVLSAQEIINSSTPVNPVGGNHYVNAYALTQGVSAFTPAMPEGTVINGDNPDVLMTYQAEFEDTSNATLAFQINDDGCEPTCGDVVLVGEVGGSQTVSSRSTIEVLNFESGQTYGSQTLNQAIVQAGAQYQFDFTPPPVVVPE